MSSFTFPPPPPPPPKAAPAPDYAEFASRGLGRSRGVARHQANRGGSQRGRGPGGSSSSPQNHNPNTAQHQGQHRSNPNFDPLRGNSDHDCGQKRKRDDFTSRHDGPVPRKSGVAPAIPSFGGPLIVPSRPPQPLAKQTAPITAVPQSASVRRKTNLFGLGLYSEESSASEDKDDDEAAMAAASSNPLEVSYAGKTLDLSSNKVLAEWIAERKRNWPTKARVAAKKQLELKQQQNALRRKLEQAQARKKAESQTLSTKDGIAPPENPAAKKLTKVERLREKLAKAEAKAAAKTAIKVEEKPSQPVAPASVKKDNPSALKSDLVDSTYADSDSSIAEGSESNVDLTSSTSEASSDKDEDVEAEPVEPSPGIDQQPAMTENLTGSRTAPPGANTQVCRSFASTGRCVRGKHCRYKHERARRKKPPIQEDTKRRKSLYQRFVEQEQKSEDRQILEAIRYLGQHGHLEGPQS